jgi:hypothetical protein
MYIPVRAYSYRDCARYRMSVLVNAVHPGLAAAMRAHRPY